MATTVPGAAPGLVFEGAHAHTDDRSFIRKYIFSTDHKIIGIQFLIMSLMFLLLGGTLAMLMRWQLGFPGRPVPGGGVLPEGMAAIPLDPGIICTEMLRRCFGSGASRYPDPASWAEIAVPFL